MGNVMNSPIDDFVAIAFSICYAFYGLLLIYLVMDTPSSHSGFNYKITIVNAKFAVLSLLSQLFEAVVVASLKFIIGGISLSSIFAARF